jgi:hypothetical protein
MGCIVWRLIKATGEVEQLSRVYDDVDACITHVNSILQQPELFVYFYTIVSVVN